MALTVNAALWGPVDEPAPKPEADPIYLPARLPEPPAWGPAETASGRGLVVLLFVLAERVTATVGDRDLELAAHAVTLAGARPDWRELPAAYLDRVADAGRLIAGALRARQQAARAPVGVGGPVDERPALGPMAPLSPVPSTRPPTPARVRPVPVPDPVEF